MDDIPGTVEQKFSLMLLERIDTLTDALNKQEKALNTLISHLPPDNLPRKIEHHEDMYDRHMLCFISITLKTNDDNTYTIIRQHLYNDSNVERFAPFLYNNKDLYESVETSGMTIQMLVYFEKKECISRFALNLYNVIEKGVDSMVVHNLSHRLDILYYECLLAACQQDKHVSELRFGTEERLECDAPRLEDEPYLVGYDVEGTREFMSWKSMMRERYRCERRGELEFHHTFYQCHYKIPIDI